MARMLLLALILAACRHPVPPHLDPNAPARSGGPADDAQPLPCPLGDVETVHAVHDEVRVAGRTYELDGQLAVLEADLLRCGADDAISALRAWREACAADALGQRPSTGVEVQAVAAEMVRGADEQRTGLSPTGRAPDPAKTEAPCPSGEESRQEFVQAVLDIP